MRGLRAATHFQNSSNSTTLAIQYSLRYNNNFYFRSQTRRARHASTIPAKSSSTSPSRSSTSKSSATTSTKPPINALSKSSTSRSSATTTSTTAPTIPSSKTSTPQHSTTQPSPTTPISPPSKPSLINGPPTTLPAALSTPTRAPDQNLPSHLFALGKAYVTFYKTGIKNIYTNYNLSKAIKSRLAQSNTSIPDAVSKNLITRSEFQLLHRNAHDMKRVPIFGLILLVCGEFTPLIVIAISEVVPWTCRIPKQIASDRRKLEKRRSISFREMTEDPTSTVVGGKLDKWQLRHINSSLGLSSKLWEWGFGPPEMVLRARVKKAIEYLERDDRLIWKAGGVGGMDVEEVRMACVERGINVIGPNDAMLKKTLDAWLRSTHKVGIEKLLLTRPNVWPVASKVEELVKL